MASQIPVYSIAKPFLAQAVLELEVPLESPLDSVVPGLEPVYASRRIAALLNHTSGLGDYTQLPDYREAVAAGEAAWDRENLLSRCVGESHNHVGFHYSNIGYLLLRMLIERETGVGLFAALEQLIFKPLGIHSVSEWESASDVVPGYDPRWVYSGTFLCEPSQVGPAVATLVQHRAQGLGLSAGWVAVDHEDTGFDGPGYNYGFMTDGGDESEPPVRVGHGGSGPGFGLMALVDVATGRSEFEYATEGFDQTAAIGRMRAAFDGG